MPVDDGQLAFVRGGGNPLKSEFLSGGEIEQGEILSGRADEDQVVVLGIVEREQPSAFDMKGAPHQAEGAVQSVHREHLAHAGVVIEDHIPRVAGGIEIAHPRFRAADEDRVAEDHPGIFRRR